MAATNPIPCSSAGAVPALDIVDETFLAVPPGPVAAAFADEACWRRYWPDLVLDVYTDRGVRGMRWTVRGALIGTMEVWLEPVLDGTLLHYFLRASPANASKRRSWRRRGTARREFDHRARSAKAVALRLKEQLEDGREAGVAPRHAGQCLS